MKLEQKKKSLILPLSLTIIWIDQMLCGLIRVMMLACFNFVPTVISGFPTLLWVFNSSFNHLGNRVLEKFLWSSCMITFRILLGSTCQNGRRHSWFPVLKQSETGQLGFLNLCLDYPHLVWTTWEPSRIQWEFSSQGTIITLIRWAETIFHKHVRMALRIMFPKHGAISEACHP